jgi:hypothetical protein
MCLRACVFYGWIEIIVCCAIAVKAWSEMKTTNNRFLLAVLPLSVRTWVSHKSLINAPCWQRSTRFERTTFFVGFSPKAFPAWGTNSLRKFATNSSTFRFQYSLVTYEVTPCDRWCEKPDIPLVVTHWVSILPEGTNPSISNAWRSGLLSVKKNFMTPSGVHYRSPVKKDLNVAARRKLTTRRSR